FDPTRGREPQKMRPALVVSAWDFNISNSMTIVCPISSRADSFPLHEPLPPACCVSGCVIMEQARAIDLEARSCRKLGTLDDAALQPILTCLRSFF
ncbi:MAG: type II toxin-antitoxin system PemK/MazF family toxin, partial [Raoultibacter sp.]